MKAAVQKILHGYRRWVSPALPPACRFVPSCSEYAQEAVERHGVVPGLALSVWRLMRCHPLVRGGLDPVPQQLRIHSHHRDGRHN
jgi:putative membrane protein insertion efficiency factor